MAEQRSRRDDFLDLDEDPNPTPAPSVEQIDDQVALAQERLLALKRQAEQLEREKAKLEELSRRQDGATGALVQDVVLEAADDLGAAGVELQGLGVEGLDPAGIDPRGIDSGQGA
ncbi:MAG: hypothetical protein ACKOKC_02885 [Chthoniobacterales bacterium]